MEELEHLSPDDLDRLPTRSGFSAAPEVWASFRRSWAAQALARLEHEPALPMIIERLRLTKRGRAYEVARGLDWAEIPGYIDAAGDFLRPELSDAALLPFVLHGDQALLDRAGRRLSLQSGPALAPALEKRAASLEECPGEMPECLREKLEERYIPLLRLGASCKTLDCWLERLGAEDESIRERAVYQVTLLTRGEAAGAPRARSALVEALLRERSTRVVEGLALALGRVDPGGCSQEELDRLEARVVELRVTPSSGPLRRAVDGLRGLLAAARARRQGP